MTEKRISAVEGPCNPSRSEYGAYLRFLSRCYGYSDPRWFERYAPRFYGPLRAQLADKWVFKASGRIVAHVGVFPFTCVVEGGRMRVAGIGGVATDPSFRGRGFMQDLLEFVDRRNRDQGYALSILWGDRWRYNQFGYERALVHNRFVFSRRFFRRPPGDGAVRRAAPLDLPVLHRLFSRHPFRCQRDRTGQRLALSRHLEGQEPRILVWEGKRGVAAYAMFFRDRERSPRNWGLAEWGGTEKHVMTLMGYFLHQEGVGAVVASFPEGGNLFREAALQCDEMTRSTLGGMVRILDLGRVLKAFERQMRERYAADPLRQSGEWSLGLEGGAPVTLSAEREFRVFPGRSARNHVTLKPLDATRLLFGDTPPENPLTDDEATARFLDALFPLSWYWWRSDWI